MGFNTFPVYAEDLASAIEASRKIIAKIESNKYDEQDLKELAIINAEIIKYATINEN